MAAVCARPIDSLLCLLQFGQDLYAIQGVRSVLPRWNSTRKVVYPLSSLKGSKTVAFIPLIARISAISLKTR